MKTIIIFLLLTTSIGIAYSQTKVPSDLKQAISTLERDCPDSLKTIIKITPNAKLDNLIYPGVIITAKSYRTIFEWFNEENSGKKIDEYLSNNGIKYNPHKQIVILTAFKQKLLGLPIHQDSIFAPFKKTELKWQKEDEARFTSDSLRGVYIPKNLEDCFNQLNIFFNDSTKAKIRVLTENQFSVRYHLGFGTWLRNNWGLWQGSRLSKYLIDLGINNAEDMSGIIFNSYHRHLLSQPIMLEEQINFYRDYWEKVKKAELESKTKEFSEYHLSDTLKYTYPFQYVSSQQEECVDNETCMSKGVIIAKNEKALLLKIKIIETCDNKGIITYDNANTLVYDKKLKHFIKPKRRVIVKSKKADEVWMNYKHWESKD